MVETGFNRTFMQQMSPMTVNCRESMASKEAMRKSIQEGRFSPELNSATSRHKRSIIVRRTDEADKAGDKLLTSLVG
jgi:hypothetical protein